MKSKNYVIVGLILGLCAGNSWAQETPKKKEAQTVVTSDQFKLDMGKKEGVFTGSVTVKSSDFELKASEMVVYFAADSSKVERLIARGNVTIEQEKRTARANEAEYSVASDKIVLTGSPEVTQEKNKIVGTTITIYRTDNRMQVDGRTKMVLFEELSKQDGSKP
jgi:lipopolysaccharide transport protein LptA